MKTLYAVLLALALNNSTHYIDVPASVSIPAHPNIPENLVNIKKYSQINRKDIHDLVKEKKDVYLFGSALDSIVGKTSKDVFIPYNFMVDSMDAYIIVSKNDKKLQFYQKYDGKDVLLLETSVAVGMGKVEGVFATPTGQFYIKRIVADPWYYPPEWSADRRSQKPGPKNDYGLWMAEICTDSIPSGYEFSPPGDSYFRMHSTNKPGSIGRFSSHGCVRLHPDVVAEFFPALLHYLPHKDPGMNPGELRRGTIYPLKNPIPIMIQE